MTSAICERPMTDDAHQNAAWLIRLGDASLVLGHRLSEWSSRAPTLEEDIALSNLALDLIGQTRALYGRACILEGGARDEDMLAYRRAEHEFRNPLLVEQPNGNFAGTMVRHLIFSAYALPLFEALRQSTDAEVAGIATRSSRELTYHVRHASEWVIRLGDGTAESHAKTRDALAELWPYVPELFDADDLDRQVAASGFGVDPSTLRGSFDVTIGHVLERATLKRPREVHGQRGGRQGVHSEHLGHMLATMQHLQRAYPDAVW
jgi:ring-1,2-phenylacetyl-CoA epoxidase subunit PaaC